MHSSKHLVFLALVFVQLLGAINCGYFDKTDTWADDYDKSMSIPDNAVFGGYDSNGYKNYVARVIYSSSVYPARVAFDTGRCTFNNENAALQASYYDILVSNSTVSYHWARSFDGYMEKNAVFVGTNSVNDRVYICRALTDNGLYIGTLILSTRVCIIRVDNFPLRQFAKYETLVRKIKPVQRNPIDLLIVEN